MKLKCPRCGSANELEETNDAEARTRVCASCGAELSADARARRVGGYDGYAVGLRVLKFVPAWFFLCIGCFVGVLLLFKWAARPVGNAGAREDDFRNEATNRPPPLKPSPPDSHTNVKPTDRPREDVGRELVESSESGDANATDANARRGGDAQSVSEAEELASYSVQAGAFDDRSQANELVSRLRAAGFDARVVEAEDSRRFRYQVRSGLFQTREEAARLAAQLRPKGFGQTVIIEPGQK